MPILVKNMNRAFAKYNDSGDFANALFIFLSWIGMMAGKLFILA